MVEILCGVLGGGAIANEVGGIRYRGKLVRVSQCYIAIDVAHFMPVEEFTARMEKLVGLVKSTPAAPGYGAPQSASVLVPPLPAARSPLPSRRPSPTQ